MSTTTSQKKSSINHWNILGTIDLRCFKYIRAKFQIGEHENIVTLVWHY
jgi:hypothetical protein